MLAGFQRVGAKARWSQGFTFYGRSEGRLSLDYTASNTLETCDGKLTGRIEGNIVGAEAKAASHPNQQRDRRPCGLTVAIGDGANDPPMLAQADAVSPSRCRSCEKSGHLCHRSLGPDALNLFTHGLWIDLWPAPGYI